MNIETILDRKTDGVVTIDISSNLQTAADLMMHHRIAALIVMKHSQPVSLLSERELVAAMAEKGPRAAETLIRDLVMDSMLTVSPEESLKRAMTLMTTKRVRHLPVVEDEELIGIVSLGDVIKFRLDEMQMESNVLRDLAIAVR
jgi:CBS domain-containing protein